MFGKIFYKVGGVCMILFAICVVLLVIILALKNGSSASNENASSNTNEKSFNKIYFKKKLMTQCEEDFYKKMVYLENELYIRIVPQVCLGAIIEKENDARYRNELFRIVDFAVFNNDFSEILLAIELNDRSHNNHYRNDRDNNVKRILNEAGIKLITFYTNMSNTTEYVQNRIKQNIGDIH